MNELDFSNELKMLGDLLVSQYRDVLAREGINATDRLSNTAGVEVTKGGDVLGSLVAVGGLLEIRGIWPTSGKASAHRCYREMDRGQARNPHSRC